MGYPTRRGFLKQTGSAVLGSSLLGRNAVTAGEKRNKTFEIIDCHTHFYDPTRPQGVPWPGKNSKLYRTVLPKDLRAQPQAKPVTGTVVVEASGWLEDNQWLLDLAKEDPFVVGVVGNLDPTDDDFAKHVKRFSQNKLYRGIRIAHQSASKLIEAGQEKKLLALADADLELDVNGGPDMPNAVAALAKALPQLRIVVNHIANVRITSDPPPKKWALALQNAAQFNNVFCKVSALVEGAGRGKDKPPDNIEFYKPYIDVVWQAFGEDRLIYGSNWPVSDRAANYKTLQQIVLEYFAEKGDAVSRKFFSKNAKIAYKWVERNGRNTSNGHN